MAYLWYTDKDSFIVHLCTGIARTALAKGKEILSKSLRSNCDL